MIDKSVYQRIPFEDAKITLCGSTRFSEAFEYWNTQLTMAGNIVYSVAVMSHHANKEGLLSTDEKNLLDAVHLKKIDNSDCIFVIDIGGYIGESTAREIEYAKIKNKEVILLSQFDMPQNIPQALCA